MNGVKPQEAGCSENLLPPTSHLQDQKRKIKQGNEKGFT
jgi:hypothetical protein